MCIRDRSDDPLLQTITIASPRNISVTERCKMKKSWTQRKWTLAQYTRFTIPITCQLISEAINCSAVRIKSNTRNAFPNLQSQILEQKWELKKPQEYSFLNTSLQVYSMWTGGIIMIILIIHTGIKLLKSTLCDRNTEEIISINHAIPSAPTDLDLSLIHI